MVSSPDDIAKTKSPTSHFLYINILPDRLFLIMKIQLFILIASFFMINAGMEINFGNQKMGNDWNIINDGVMGGLSKGRVTFTENTLSFTGSVSLANNGGFTSFKSPFQIYDLSAYDHVSIRMKGKGQKFALTLETNEIWYLPYFKKEMTLDGKDWQTVKLKLADFQEYRIGRRTGNLLSKSKSARVLRLGITTNDKREGPFELEIDYIKFE